MYRFYFLFYMVFVFTAGTSVSFATLPQEEIELTVSPNYNAEMAGDALERIYNSKGTITYDKIDRNIAIELLRALDAATPHTKLFNRKGRSNVKIKSMHVHNEVAENAKSVIIVDNIKIDSNATTFMVSLVAAPSSGAQRHVAFGTFTSSRGDHVMTRDGVSWFKKYAGQKVVINTPQ
ncbi:MAG: hypothetical protein ABFQ95_06900 [Pseudomonadota bacterium]